MKYSDLSKVDSTKGLAMGWRKNEGVTKGWHVKGVAKDHGAALQFAVTQLTR